MCLDAVRAKNLRGFSAAHATCTDRNNGLFPLLDSIDFLAELRQRYVHGILHVPALIFALATDIYDDGIVVEQVCDVGAGGEQRLQPVEHVPTSSFRF